MAHIDYGAILVRQQRFVEAIAEFQEALRHRPNSPESAGIHYNLGVALTQCNRPDEAISHFREALKIEPTCIEVQNRLGLLLADRGQIEEAAACFEEILKAKPDSAEARCNLGVLWMRRGQLDEAVACFQKVLDMSAENAQAHECLERALLQRKNLERVLAEQRERVRSRPDDPTVLSDLAWSLATNPNDSIRNGGEALEFAQRAAELSDGQEPAILDTLAAAYAEAGRFSEAVQTARKALDLAAQQDKVVLGESIKARLRFYESDVPFREIRGPLSRPAPP